MRSFATILGVCALAGAPALAQDAAEAAPERPPWLIGCSNEIDPATLVCEMSQSIVLTEGNRRLATAGFVKVRGEPDIRGVFTLPVGLSIPDGLTVLVDDAEIATLDYATCDQVGCRAVGPVGEDWLAAMDSGTEMQLRISRQDGETMTFGIDLSGFPEVFDVLP